MIFSDPIAALSKWFPTRPAIYFEDRTLTYSELHHAIEAKRSVVTSYKEWAVAALVEDDYEAILLLWACIREKRVFFLLNPKLPEASRLKLCKETDTVYLSSSLASSSQTMTHEEILLSLNQPVTLVATSGSTGQPKYVVHSLENHMASALASSGTIPFSFPDTWLLTVPLFHVSGLSIVFRTFFSGASLVIPKKGQALSDALSYFKPTHLSVVPTQLLRLDLTQDHSFLKHVLVGGAYLPESLYKTYAPHLPLHLTYGLTEMASQVVTDNKVLASAEVRLDPRSQEILVRGPSLCLGYYERGFIRQTVDSDHWFHTRDVGSWENGVFTLRGRLDRMFISGGENIFPEEIEKVALAFDGILFAVVLSIPHSDYGSRPVLFFYAESDVDNDALMLHLKYHLPRFKCPDMLLKLPDTTLLYPKPKSFRYFVRQR